MSSYLESQRDPLTVSRYFCIFLFILCIACCWLKDVEWGSGYFLAQMVFSCFLISARRLFCAQRVRARDRQRRRAGETSGGTHVLCVGERPASPILKSMVAAVSREEEGEKGFPFSRTRPRHENPRTSNRRTHVALPRRASANLRRRSGRLLEIHVVSFSSRSHDFRIAHPLIDF